MAYTLVVEKQQARIVFVKDSAAPLLTDALWPSTSHNYVLWPKSVGAAVFASPWNHVISDGVIVQSPCTYASVARQNAMKGELLVHLARAVNRNRRLVCKEYLLVQDIVYEKKFVAASEFIRTGQSSNMAWLTAASENSGLSLLQEANQIVFRHTQADNILLDSETKRQTFTRRILQSTATDADALRAEITSYERKG